MTPSVRAGAGPQTGSPSLPLTATLLNHPIRLEEDRLRNRQAERFGGLEVDHKLELGGLLNGEVGGLGALEDLDVISTLASCPA